MKTAVQYRQCKLVKKAPTGWGEFVYMAWIPEQFAKLGMTLKLKSEDGTWLDGWEVKWTSLCAVDEPECFMKVCRDHRRNTGDSLPKAG